MHEKIRQTREAKGLTQSGLGFRIGQPQSTVSRIERGGGLRLSTPLEMARVLELDQGRTGAKQSSSQLHGIVFEFPIEQNRPKKCGCGIKTPFLLAVCSIRIGIKNAFEVRPHPGKHQVPTLCRHIVQSLSP
jgi:transcriptional regulator with XRE-family HTH domain